MTLKEKIERRLLNRYKKKWYQEFLSEKANDEKKIPKFELAEKHISNAKLLTDRDALLNLMPQNAVCAEIGVNEGEFSKKILDLTKPSKLHLVDAWNDEIYHNGLRDLVLKKFELEINADIIKVNIGYSTDVLTTFQDNFFDWVYLDTAHTYDITAQELNILKTKMKPDGIIAGHDYVTGWWMGWFRYGVIEAIHELCVNDNWELIYLTTETHQHRSFAIRKIQ